jgi:mutual gliding-motility protein MglA
MLEYNEGNGVMTWKIVYCGTTFSGKTTNLLALADHVPENGPGRTARLDIDNDADRPVCLDLLPGGYETRRGAKLKIMVFGVSGRVRDSYAFRSALKRADGVVFVADSRKSQTISNSESFAVLENNARHIGLLFGVMPLAIQFNKRDLPSREIISESRIVESWKCSHAPLFLASALNGNGVMETFTAVVSDVCRFLENQFGISEKFGFNADELTAYLRGREQIVTQAQLDAFYDNREFAG